MRTNWDAVWAGDSYSSPDLRRRKALFKIQSLEALGVDFTGMDRLLDVGCGAGWVARALVERFKISVVAIDKSLTALSYARDNNAHPLISYRLAEGHETPGVFDAVLMLSVLEHVPFPKELLDRYLATLRPGGTCMIAWSNVTSPYFVEHHLRRTLGRWPYGFTREISHHSLSGLLSSTGLRVQQSAVRPDTEASFLASLDRAANRMWRKMGRYIFATGEQ